jgi:hypothetical protein
VGGISSFLTARKIFFPHRAPCPAGYYEKRGPLAIDNIRLAVYKDIYEKPGPFF